ncbi:Spermine oxidase [Cryptotermes secundus]|nr:Spermine oxidase [Cryptotermes secundus]
MWPIYVFTAELLVVTLFIITDIFLPMRRISEVRVIIVGAGASGIAAATSLVEHGIDNIMILEAENRTGGRINTVPFGNGVVELGCQWVHGEEGNAVFSMASQYGLLMDSVINYDIEKMVFIGSSGNIVNRKTTEELYGILREISNSSKTDLVNYTGSLGEYFSHKYKQKLEGHPLSNSSLARAFLDWVHKGSNIEDAADSWYETSGHGQVEYQVCKGKQTWAWKSGYSTVLDLLKKRIPDPSNELPVESKTNFKAEVNKIRWNNLSGENKNKVAVECSDGSVHVADHVILTLSLGVLKKRGDFMFQPALPAQKLNAIKGLCIGNVDKILLKYPYRWWPDNFTVFSVLKTNETAACIGEKCWVHDIHVFEVVDNQPHVLSAWLSGSAARHMEQLPEEQLMQETIEFIREFMGKAFNVTVPSPEELLRSSWSSNPHFHGSYSFRCMETERLNVSAAQLAEPVINNNGISVLLFAGEATHSSYYSTVHGAIESGWREAKRLTEFYK